MQECFFPLFPLLTQNSWASVRVAGDTSWGRGQCGSEVKQLEACSRNRVCHPILIWTTNSNNHKGVSLIMVQAQWVPCSYPVAFKYNMGICNICDLQVWKHRDDLFPLGSQAVNPTPIQEEVNECHLAQEQLWTLWSTIFFSTLSYSRQDTIRHLPKQLEMASVQRCPEGVQMDYGFRWTKPILDKQIMGLTIICT